MMFRGLRVGLATSAFATMGLFSCANVAVAADKAVAAANGKLELKSIGPIANGPPGILLVGDPLGAAVYAISVKTEAATPQAAEFKLAGVDKKVADLLGVKPNALSINDIVVQPGSGTIFLSVTRGKGAHAAAVIVTVDGQGNVAEFVLDKVAYNKVSLSNVPSADAKGRGGVPMRLESITDLAFVDGQIVVAGLSNEEFASKLRTIAYPLSDSDEGTSVEIYHGAHGKLETRSPVRTFVPMVVAGKPHLIAAYTCTPLVKFPLDDLKPGKKIRGTTIAELGNRNRPLDMIVYQKNGGSFILMANSARGVMKIPTAGFAEQEGIESRVSSTAGIKYETIADLKGVVHLAKWNDQSALILVENADKSLDLKTVANP